jgi:hypothetical protein
MARKTARPARPARPIAADNPNTAATVVRLDPVLLEALDAWADKLNAATPEAPPWSRTNIIRASLARAVRERGEKGESP